MGCCGANKCKVANSQVHPWAIDHRNDLPGVSSKSTGVQVFINKELVVEEASPSDPEDDEQQLEQLAGTRQIIIF